MKLNRQIVFVYLFVIFVLSFTNAKPRGSGRNRGRKGDDKKATSINRIRDCLSPNTRTGKVDFPDEMEFDFMVKGKKPIRSMSRKVSVHRPLPVFDSNGRPHRRVQKNEEFYVDDNGSYQVAAYLSANGSIDTEVKAMYRNGEGEKCFFVRGESHCWRIDGEGTFNSISREGDAVEVTSTNATEKRRKRQLVYTDLKPSRIAQVVYVVDKAFIDWFRQLSGDDSTAIQDAEDYINMLNNEVNYMYRGIKEVSEASSTIADMDISIYAKGFFYPTIGTEWSWLTPFVTTTNLDTGVLQTFGNWVGDGNVDRSGSFDTVAFISPRSFNGGSVLGVAYTGTVCNPRATNSKVSINSDRSLDVALTLVHEMGHSFRAFHDGTDDCPNETYIMSSAYFDISTQTQNTWNRWSTCSVQQIVQHVSNYPGCLLDGNISDDDFYDQLCEGVRGSNQFDLDYQCKTSNKYQSSVACAPSDTVTSGKVSPRACWDDYQIGCTLGDGRCYLTVATIFDGTPCMGADASKDYVCYRGDCLEKVDVCSGRSTTTVAPTTTTVPTTTAAPTTTTAPTTTAETTTTNAPTTTVAPTTTAATTTTTAAATTTTAEPTTTVAPTTTAAPTTTTAPTTTAVPTTTATPFSTTTSVEPTPPRTSSATTTGQPTSPTPRCSCRGRTGRSLRRCCNRKRNVDGSCCRGCRLNRRRNVCRPRNNTSRLASSYEEIYNESDMSFSDYI